MVKPDLKSMSSLLTFSHCSSPAFTRHSCLLSGGQRETPRSPEQGKTLAHPTCFLGSQH